MDTALNEPNRDPGGLVAHLVAGHAAPDFSLTALDGKTYSLSSLLQRGPVVLAFFKISCPVCQFTFPFLQRIADRLMGETVSILGVSQDDTKLTKHFNQEYCVKFPTVLDRDGYPVSNAYGITNVPTVFLIAPSGKITVECMGFDKAALEKIAEEVAQYEKVAAAPLFLRDEVVPAYKPG
jgi:peroxiredoxin